MRYRKIILFAAIFCMLVGCSASDKRKLRFDETINLSGQNWEVNEHLGKVFNISLMDDFVALRNDWGETLLTLIGISDRNRVYHFGKRGGEPSELINPGSMISGSEYLDVFDGTKMSLMHYEADSIVASDSLATRIRFHTSLPGIISLVSLQDSNYVASGVFRGGAALPNGQKWDGMCLCG